MSNKIIYRVRNWKEYNRSLVNRGNLTLWFSDDTIKSWYQKPQKHKNRGRPTLYSDAYIELALTIRTLFHPRKMLVVFMLTELIHLNKDLMR